MDKTSYAPLSEVRKELKVKWQRPKIDAEKLRELSKRSDLEGWIQSLGHLAIWLVTGTSVFYFWSQSLWLPFAIALFLHGTIASFFIGIAPHELGHGSVFKSKILNKIFLYIYSCLGWWNHFDYASSHTYHHRYTLHPDGDRENLLPISPLVGPFFLLQLFTINLLTKPGRTFSKGGLLATMYVTFLGALGKVGPQDIPSQEWLQALHEDQPEEHKKAMWWDRFMLLFHATIIIASLLSGAFMLWA
jgi:fatty acid desaturase